MVEFPRVYSDKYGVIRVYPALDEKGIALFPDGHKCAAYHETFCISEGDELLTGPARAEVLAKLGIKVGG